VRRAEPLGALAAAAVVVVAIEAAVPHAEYRYGPECIAVALALAAVWRRRDRLSPAPLVALAVALPAAVAAVHLARGVHGDRDLELVYQPQGQSLLDGTYPHSEYPPGAVLLFAFEALVRDARSVNPFAMAVCAGATVWGLCALRSGIARWLAAAVALWPVNAYFWEFKYDLLPTALLVLGLVLAGRGRWASSGALLGLGAAAKWSPGLAFLVLAVWLVAGGRPREALRHSAGFVLAAAVVVVPPLAWSPGAVWASVSKQAPRGITPESFWYLPFRAIGQASRPDAVFAPAAVPHWANTVAVVAQVLVVAAIVAGVALTRPSLPAALVAAASAPATFLLLNKVFSAQYAVTILAAGAFAAGALVAEAARRVLLVVGLLLVATAANVFVYPIGRHWLLASLLLFVTALTAFLELLRSTILHVGFTPARYPPQS
jgi:hypothetical protein